jgi:hypothetical protein
VELAEGDRPDDFLVSERLISMAIAQISESPQLAEVFTALLDSDGVAVALAPWEDYAPNGRVTFKELIGIAHRRGETAIGWRCTALQGRQGDLGDGTFINPAKASEAHFGGQDRVILLR